jgi:hypothetical protein
MAENGHVTVEANVRLTLDERAYHGAMEADSHSVLLGRSGKLFGNSDCWTRIVRQILLPKLPKITIFEREFRPSTLFWAKEAFCLARLGD